MPGLSSLRYLILSAGRMGSMIALVSLCLRPFPAFTETAGVDEFLLGTAKAEITPPTGYRMAGGFSEVISTGVNDPLYAKAMAWKQGNTQAVIVVCDVCSVPRMYTDPIRRRISADTGTPVSNIAVLATHTHGGPEYYGVLRDALHRLAAEKEGTDPRETIDFPALFMDQCVAAAGEAYRHLRPVRIATGSTTLPGIAQNRRYHMKDGSVRFNPGKQNPDIVKSAGPVDEEVPILFFRDAEENRPVASLVMFAMHVASFYNGQFGADYPGVLQTILREQVGPDFFSVFTQGTAGDVNHFNVTVPTPDPSPEAIGQALAGVVMKALPGLKPAAAPSLAVRSIRIPVPMQEFTDEDVARAEDIIHYRITPTPDFYVSVHAWKILNTRNLAARDGANLQMEVQGFRLDGDTAVVTLPHEVFVELGLAIKKQSPFVRTLVASMANDLDFYVPTRKAFAEGSYEVDTSSIKPGGGELLVAGALQLLNGLKAAPGGE
ncbi:MAG: neutral/alkaline non-lysosomal ceramidase N-terminal domain-containing protein [bacterium]